MGTSKGGRPRLDRGELGSISYTAQRLVDGKWSAVETEQAQRWRARVRLRDDDGKYRYVERIATTKGKAQTALRKALAERTAPASGGDVEPGTLVADAADMWLQWFKRPERKKAERTIDLYARSIEWYIKGVPGVAALSLREANTVQTIDRWLQRVADERGAGAAKTARSVLSNVMTWATRTGVLPFNAVRNVDSTPQPSKPITRPVSGKRAQALGESAGTADRSRAFSDAERQHLRNFLDADDKANRTDTADLVRFLLGTGVRFNEALPLRWSDLDLEAATVHVRGTKTARSDRVLPLPSWLVDVLRERREHLGASGLVFASRRTGALRTERAAWRNVRDILDRAGYPWAVGHTFRRTVATLIASKYGPGAAADQLGHADASLTMRVYWGKREGVAQVADALD